MDLNTGSAKILKRGETVLLCRPRLKKAVAILHYVWGPEPEETLIEECLVAIRTLVIRKKNAFGDISEDVRKAIWKNTRLLEAEIELFEPRRLRSGRFQRRSVYYFLTMRGIKNPRMNGEWSERSKRILWFAERPRDKFGVKTKRAWIQINFGIWHRVWVGHGSLPPEYRGRSHAISKRFRNRADAEDLLMDIEEGLVKVI